MKRYDLRHLHANFYDRMTELIDEGLAVGEVGIFLFEIGDFSPIQKSADLIKESGHELMNSLKFNEVDWTIVVKKLDADTARKRAEAVAAAKREAEEAARRAEEEAKAKAKAEAEAKAKAEEEAKQKAEEEAKAKAEAEAKAKAEAKAEEEAKKKAEAEAAQKAKAEAKAKAKEKEEAQKEAEAKATSSKEVKTPPSKGGKKAAAKKPAPKKKENLKGEDLTVIKGIGKVYMEKLHNEGIYTIEDVANMNEEQIQVMEEKYSFKGDFKDSVADAKRMLKQKAD